jgi:soluble lytic murein transglycosylase
MKRYLVVLLLFALTAIMVIVVDRPRLSVAADQQEQEPVPREALDALEQGRYLRASLILRDFLRARPDTTPGTILLAAEAEAGWGDWERVLALLAGRSWLDSVAAGSGWSLLGRSQIALGRFDEGRRSLTRYLEIAADAGDRDRGIAELRRAAAHVELEEFTEAGAAYDRAAVLIPQLGDWIAYLKASAAAGAGDTATVTGALADVPQDVARDWGWRLDIRARRNAGDVAGAIAAAEAAARGSGTAARRAEAWASAGHMHLARGDSTLARQAYRTAMDLAPGTSYGVDAARALNDLPRPTLNDRLAIGRIYLRHGNVARGVTGVQAYLDAGAGSPAERTRLRLELGRALFNAGRYRDAERALLAVADQSTQPATAAQALFLAGRAQYRDGREDMGRGTFLRVAQTYPGQVAGVEAMFLSADLDHDDGNLVRASERYRRTIAMNIDADEVGLAYMRLAGIAYADGDFGRALERFESYRTRYPRGQRWNQATYWAARARSELGEETAARELLRAVWQRDPLSYYGGRAAELLNVPFWNVPLEAAPQPDPRHHEEVLRALARVDLLREIPLGDAASYELDRARRRFVAADDALYAFAEALNARGYTTMAITLGWDIRRREGGWNDRLLRIIYPFPYRDIIVAEAERRGVDPFLAAGIIRQESMFNAGAVSPAGAIGLMQVMPETGRILARELDVGTFTPDLLEEPEFNVTLGMNYLADQLDAYDGRLPVVLSAYNAGPTRVARWRTIFPEFSDDELFAERIPFEETREYVKIVQQNRRIYRALYTEPPAAGSGRQ